MDSQIPANSYSQMHVEKVSLAQSDFMSGLNNDPVLGILGGGQLGRMLLQKAADFNLSTAVLDPDPDAPSRYLTNRFVAGNFNDYQTVLDFGRTVNLLTVEIEHVNVEALEQL